MDVLVANFSSTTFLIIIVVITHFVPSRITAPNLRRYVQRFCVCVDNTEVDAYIVSILLSCVAELGLHYIYKLVSLFRMNAQVPCVKLLLSLFII